jgi:hypothetical protein
MKPSVAPVGMTAACGTPVGLTAGYGIDRERLNRYEYTERFEVE